MPSSFLDVGDAVEVGMDFAGGDFGAHADQRCNPTVGLDVAIRRRVITDENWRTDKAPFDLRDRQLGNRGEFGQEQRRPHRQGVGDWLRLLIHLSPPKPHWIAC